MRRLIMDGAASRQELEEVTAVHVGHETEVASARQRLLLLGLTRQEVDDLTDPSKVVSQVVVPAPIGGAVTARWANPGQVVAIGQELFVVTDLGTVWLVGDLYEQDFATVRVGSGATVTTAAYLGSDSHDLTLCPDLCPTSTPAHIKGATMDRLIRIARTRVSAGRISLREDPRVDAAVTQTAVPS